MQAKLIGVQEIHFTNNNGEEINGINIFCTFKDESVSGEKAAKFFLKNGINLPKDIKLNDTINLSFNMKGKVEMVFKTN